MKLDRCLMAHGLEGRTPFLDPEVAELAFRLPDALKIRNGMGKYILRKWLARALPAADAFSRKRGFTVPVGEWIAKRASALAPLVARSDGIAQICHADKVDAAVPRLRRQRRQARKAPPAGNFCSTRCGTGFMSKAGPPRATS